MSGSVFLHYLRWFNRPDKQAEMFCRYEGKPTFIHVPLGTTTTQSAMGLALTLGGEKFDSLSSQVWLPRCNNTTVR